MRTLVLLCSLLPACTLTPPSPEQRIAFQQHLNAQAQRDHESSMQNAAIQQSYIQNAFPPRRDYPTYYARPDPLYPGGSVITPNRFGY